MSDPLEVIRAKKAEYEVEVKRLEDERLAFIGAIAACDDIIKALEGNENENKNPE